MKNFIPIVLILCGLMATNAARAQVAQLPTAAVANECESTDSAGGTCYQAYAGNAAGIQCQAYGSSLSPGQYAAAVQADFGASIPNSINACYYSPAAAMPAPFIGARTQPGSGQSTGGEAIDVWGTCRYIDNPSANAYFVPFRTNNEWTQFLNSAASGPMKNNIAMTPCARSYILTDTVSGDATLWHPANDSVAGETVSDQQLCNATPVTSHLPYERVTLPATELTRTVAVSCQPVCYTDTTTGNSKCGSAWTNTATLDFTPRDSDDYSSKDRSLADWVDRVIYSGHPADASPSCDPRARNAPVTSACSASCGGTATTTQTDGCGNVISSSTEACGSVCVDDGGGSGCQSLGHCAGNSPGANQGGGTAGGPSAEGNAGAASSQAGGTSGTDGGTGGTGSDGSGGTGGTGGTGSDGSGGGTGGAGQGGGPGG